ncbi:DUF2795 domain-containing protein [Streptomyces sp. DT24]|uniref:DUF2795 domain-containing protein n=1 Tax=unclassified Streptomyces TaxID=2593676 RepID=UPI0023B8BBDB|nr:DUF2795 domain-containing protein [Streptomyces sp. AM 4-1-1]WEH37076.1 DUF2795 domain-containing protein [Streptomyces sp. AM 4-1-1]
MERGSNPVSARKDDEMKHELRGYLRSGQSTHTEEDHDPEPPADDDVRVDPGGPVPPPGEEGDRVRAEAGAGTLRTELARHLTRRTFPADKASLLAALEEEHAPDELIAAVRELPADDRYANAGEIVRALGHRPAP